MNIASKLFNRQQPTEADIFNSGLDFAMEFGKNWLQPIQQRLLTEYNFLTKEQLDEYDLICKKAIQEGNKLVYDILSSLYDAQKKIESKELEEKLSNFMLGQYPWINTKNLSKLFNQSCYYAFKDGLTTCLK